MARQGVRGFSPATLRRLRTSAGLSQDDVADLAGISAQTISTWETGRSSPSATALASVAAALRVTVADLAPIWDADLVLRDLRSQAGLTQTAVAAALGIGQTQTSAIERGRYGVDETLVSQLADLYRVPELLLRTTWVRTHEKRMTRLRSY